VLLISCTNVVNLLVDRRRRTRVIGMRIAPVRPAACCCLKG